MLISFLRGIMELLAPICTLNSAARQFVCTTCMNTHLSPFFRVALRRLALFFSPYVGRMLDITHQHDTGTLSRKCNPSCFPVGDYVRTWYWNKYLCGTSPKLEVYYELQNNCPRGGPNSKIDLLNLKFIRNSTMFV